MNRNDITAILADIAETMGRVRDLDVEGHARAAALQCLEDANAHLARHVPGAVWGIAEYAAEGTARAKFELRPIQTSPFPQVALDSVPPDYPSAEDIQRTIAHASGRADLAPPRASVPPSCADNARVTGALFGGAGLTASCTRWYIRVPSEKTGKNPGSFGG